MDRPPMDQRSAGQLSRDLSDGLSDHRRIIRRRTWHDLNHGGRCDRRQRHHDDRSDGRENEHCISDFTITNGVLKAKAHCTFSDNSSSDEIYNVIADIITCTTTYLDGGTQDITVNPDGSATETVDSPSGQPEATGTVDPNGNDTINYDDGSSETINVDTNTDTTDTSTVSSVKRAAKPVMSLPHLVAPRKSR